jgi:hypothetical protein
MSVRRLATISCALLVLAVVLGLGGKALAEPGVAASAAMDGGYDLSWWSVDGGGDIFSGDGEYGLSGTIGQPDAGLRRTTGGYRLRGGFWGCGPPRYDVYLALGLKRY